MTMNFFITALFLLCFGLYYFSIKEDHRLLKRTDHHWAILVLLVLGLALRLLVAGLVHGYDTDLTAFKAWGYYANHYGFRELYSQDFFLDYPPGYMYVLSLLDHIRALFQWDQGADAYTMLIKMPAILCDLGIALLVYRMALKKGGNMLALFLASLILFNPAVAVNSAGWGQIDSVYTLLVLGSVVLLLREKKPSSGLAVKTEIPYHAILAALLYALALLIKPQALIFGPVYLFFVVQSKDWRVWLSTILTGCLTIILVALPFTKDFNFLWLYEKYISTLQSYAFASVYAFNLYALFGQTWVALEGLKFAGIPVEWIGWAFMIASVIYAAALYFKSKHPSKIWFLLFFITASFFMLGVKMHERYFFPGLIFLLFAYISCRDKRLLALFICFSATHFINVAYVLQAVNASFDPFDTVIIFTSLANVILYGYAVYLSYKIYWKGELVESAEKKEKKPGKAVPAGKKKNAVAVAMAAKKEFQYQTSEARWRLDRKDYLIMASILVFYALFAFYQLGSDKTAVTSWQPANAKEEVVLDFGESRQIDRFYYIAGIGEQEYNGDFRTGVDFTLFLSDDGAAWEEAGSYQDGYVFEWKLNSLNTSGRYAKIIPSTKQMALNEVAFFAPGEDKPIPVTVLAANPSGPENDPSRLVDEQSVIPLKPTYYDSTYFDEIYHARTAYEQLLYEEAYESTHPPLGKIFISIGIALFGMNPLGWRVSGVLFGILMLPVLYLFIRRLFHSKLLAGAGMFLFAFDFMHYTQSRIATIDTYAVFFLILMYYFMYQYFSMSFYDTKLSKTLVPLGLCGLFTGMGVASKWTVVYGILGIAVLFFVSLGRRYCEYRHSKKMVEKGRATEFEHMVCQTFVKKSVGTLACCVLFFLVVPAVIYGLSYIPYLQSGHAFGEVFAYQKNMYNYHSQLVDTHPFSSKWYEWPLMIRPIWYYSANALSVVSGHVGSIAAFGNPAVWWIGLICMVATAVIGIQKKDRKALVILIGYASVYLIWMFIPRLLFIYHYYTAVPFLVLSILYVANEFLRQDAKFKRVLLLYCGIAFALFVMFFPVLSGIEVSKTYVENYLKWFGSWIF